MIRLGFYSNGGFKRTQRECLEQEFVVEWLGMNDLRKFNGDVIIAQSCRHALIARAFSNVPIVMENHGDLGARTETLARAGTRSSRVLRAVSWHTAQELEAHNKEDLPVVVFPPWCERRRIESIRDVPPLARPSVLYFGGPHEHKGSKIVDQANRLLRHKITIVPQMPQYDAHACMRGADLVVVPSLREGFGLVALECALMGTPLVVTNVGGLGENFNFERAWIVEPGNAIELAGAIEKAILCTLQTNVQTNNAQAWARDFWTEQKYLEGYKRCVDLILSA